MQTRFYCLLVVSFLLGYQSSAQKRNITLNDLNNQVSISNLEINPQGTQAIFITSKRNLEENNYTRSLVLLNIKEKSLKIIGDTLKGIGSAAWMTDGKRISMIANTVKGRQVLILDAENGSSSIITNSPSGIIRYSMNKANSAIAYFSREESQNTNSNSFNDSFEVGSNDYLVDETPGNTSVWTKKLAEENANQITPAGFTVATGLTTSALSWSDDGTLLAFTKYPTSFSGDSDLGVNYVYDVKASKLTAVNENIKGVSSPSFTPDNKLVFNYPRDGVASNMDDWFRYDINAGQSTNLTRELDRTIYSIQWFQKDQALLTGVDSHGSAIWVMQEKQFSKVELGSLTSVSNLSVAENGSMLFTGSNSDMPEEIYFKQELKDKPQKLTRLNDWAEGVLVGKQEVIEWESSDGLKPNGVITYPPDFDPGRKYPLVLVIHGGPTAASTPDFSITIQSMAAKGWIVFQPNYRGSSNLGNKFQAAIHKDPSEGPGHDVITGVRILKEKPFVDASRVAVTGWSYGGWMTSWLIGRYPDEWIAAMAGAAPVDFTDMYSLNDLNRMRRHAIVESPYVGNNLIWAYENSPIYHFGKIKAPTLIMSKTGDSRVTVTGSYKLYGALRDNNIPVQFIAYPGGGHFPGDPVRNQDVWERWIAWIEKYVEGKMDEVKIESK